MPLQDVEFDCSLKRTTDGLAQTAEWNEDGTILSMTLRDDIKWADGTPVTTADVAFAYKMVGDRAVASPRLSYLDQLKPDAAPKVIDDTHLEWHFLHAYDRDTQTAHASLGVVPAHKLAEVDLGSIRSHASNKSPLPNGPFKLIEHKPTQSFALVPNENFSGKADEAARLKRVQFKIVPEYQTRLLLLKKGEIDLMEGIQVKDADDLVKSNPNIQLVRRGYRFNDYIAWNLNNDLFKSKAVRQALAHAVDIEFIIGKLLTSADGTRYGRTSVGTITPELCNVHNDDITPYGFDAVKSKALFAEAGWTDSNGDGILDKDGKKFRFTLVTNRENERRMEAAILIQNALKKAGVEMTIDTKEFNSMTDMLRKKQFEAVLGGWAAGLFVDPSTMWHSDTPEKKYPFNYTSYSNPEVDALIEQGLATPDPQAAAPIWKDLQAKIYEDQPYLFLWWRDEIVGIDNRFENVQIDVLSLLNNLHEWEVPADKVKYNF
jgi:peptide/nickel transport system substrate-binding protein